MKNAALAEDKRKEKLGDLLREFFLAKNNVFIMDFKKDVKTHIENIEKFQKELALDDPDVSKALIKEDDLLALINAIIDKYNKTIFSEEKKYGWLNSDNNKPYVQKLIVDVEDKIFVIGDRHGSLHSLLRAFWRLVCMGKLNNNFEIKAPKFKMIFLGDYVDRGHFYSSINSSLMKQ